MDVSYRLAIEDAPNADDERFVVERLTAYNRQHGGDDHHQRLAIFVRDDDNRILAGLLGDTYWGWLYIGILWVDDALRQHGYGTRLLQTAEQEAVRRGCHHVHVDTMSFQALPFYLKHGYTIWGELADMPVGHTRYYLKKALPSV